MSEHKSESNPAVLLERMVSQPISASLDGCSEPNTNGTKTCPKCKGNGRVVDDCAMGDIMRQLRMAAKQSLRETARKLKLSAAYLSDLELGRRGWNEERILKYRKVVNAV